MREGGKGERRRGERGREEKQTSSSTKLGQINMGFDIFDLVVDSFNKNHQFFSNPLFINILLRGGGGGGKRRERKREKKGRERPGGGGRLTVGAGKHRHIHPF